MGKQARKRAELYAVSVCDYGATIRYAGRVGRSMNGSKRLGAGDQVRQEEQRLMVAGSGQRAANVRLDLWSLVSGHEAFE